MTRPEFEIPTDWTFRSRQVADGFDAHVREQLPWYDLAAGAVAHVARHYLPENGLIYDVGASTGNLARLLAPSIDARNAGIIGIDNAQEMVDIHSGPGYILQHDARYFDYDPHDVAVLFLVLMFVPVKDRQPLLERIYDALNPGGAMIVVDKCDVDCGYAATILRRLTLAGKVATGTNADQIIAKELSLAGLQRPLDPATLPGNPTIFFRFGEFTGWLIEK